MSSSETVKNTFQAKDGLWYPSYMAMVEANKSRNEEHLRSKGLLDMAKTIKNSNKRKTTSSPRLSKPNVVTPVRRSTRSKTRRSPRLKGIKPKENVELPRELVFVGPRKKKATKPKKQAVGRAGRSVQLSKEEMDKFKNLPDWIDDFERFLLKVPHGNYNRVVSETNARDVVKQVRLLVSGIGVTYHHWKKGTYFKRGVKVHLGMDLDELYDEAVEMENNHGRDLGNGWLMRHPIGKLKFYQQYRLQKVSAKKANN